MTPEIQKWLARLVSIANHADKWLTITMASTIGQASSKEGELEPHALVQE